MEEYKKKLSLLEQQIVAEYHKLRDMGFTPRERYHTDEAMEDQLSVVADLIYERRDLMNSVWEHTPENAKRLSRTNDLLTAASRKAWELGKRTFESLKWMNEAENQEMFSVEVFVYPQWDNRKSDWRYVPDANRTPEEEEEFLRDETWHGEDPFENHVWNIITQLGDGCAANKEGIVSCFHTFDMDGKWPSFKDAILDDGESWNECIRQEVYNSIYFTHPWHRLFLDAYCFSFEDLANLNDFRVDVQVFFESKERMKS